MFAFYQYEAKVERGTWGFVPPFYNAPGAAPASTALLSYTEPLPTVCSRRAPAPAQPAAGRGSSHFTCPPSWAPRGKALSQVSKGHCSALPGRILNPARVTRCGWKELNSRGSLPSETRRGLKGQSDQRRRIWRLAKQQLLLTQVSQKSHHKNFFVPCYGPYSILLNEVISWAFMLFCLTSPSFTCRDKLLAAHLRTVLVLFACGKRDCCMEWLLSKWATTLQRSDRWNKYLKQKDREKPSLLSLNGSSRGVSETAKRQHKLKYLELQHN